MSISWLGLLMCICWGLTLLGGLGVHVLENFNGKRLEAYCRLRRRAHRFGEILDYHDQAAASAQYILLFGLVLGSLAAGAWFYTSGDVVLDEGKLRSQVGSLTIAGWVMSWLVLLTLAGLWLPKIVVRYSSSLLLYHSWPLWRLLSVVTSPFSELGEMFSWLGHRLRDGSSDEEDEEETIEDEIRTIVVAGQRDGVFSKGVPEMIQGVMELDESDVGKIMTPRSLVDLLNVDLDLNEVIRAVAACGRTRLPVYQNETDNVVGVLFAKDLLTVMADYDGIPAGMTLQSIMRKPWFIPDNKRVDELLRVFLHNRNHMAIVVDEYQQFAGVVTIEDALEEIVGEIADEMDDEEQSDCFYDEETHAVEAEGRVTIDSVEKLLGAQLPESDDYDTVGGLIVHRLSEIPDTGAQLEVNGVLITVLRATERAVQRVRLELVDDNGGSSESDVSSELGNTSTGQ